MKNIDFLESSINDIINLLQNSKSKSALDKTDALLKKNKHRHADVFFPLVATAACQWIP